MNKIRKMCNLFFACPRFLEQLYCKSMGKSELVLYQPDSAVSVEVRLENENVWLNRQQISVLFDRDIKTIGKHINNALNEELAVFSTDANFATVGEEKGENPVVANFATTAADGKVYQVEYYMT